MRPLLLAAALAVPSFADDPGGCRWDDSVGAAQGEWVKTCMTAVDDTTEEFFSTFGTSRADMSSVCMTLIEPCSIKLKAVRKTEPGMSRSPFVLRCKEVCREGDDGPRCERPPAREACGTEPAPPPERDGRQGADGEGSIKLDTGGGGYSASPCGIPDPGGSPPSTTWGWIDQCVNEAAKYKQHTEPIGRVNHANDLIIEERNGSASWKGDVPLRDAEHYLFSMVMVMAGDYASLGMASMQTTTVMCGLALGYSGFKLNPIFRHAMAIFGGGAASKPSIDEIRWGCRGALDGMTRKYPAGAN